MHFKANNKLMTPDGYFKKRKKKDQYRDQKIQNLTEKLCRNEMNTEEFLRAMTSEENGSFINHPSIINHSQ